MARCALNALAVALAVHGAWAVNVIALSSSGTAARAAEWRALVAADAEDSRFWTSVWSDLEADLNHLHDIAAPPAPVVKKEHKKSPMAGLKLNLEPKTAMDLLPALTLLKGLYEDGKERIGALNAREKDLKAKYEVKVAEHDAKLHAIEARFKNHTLSAEFRTNETRDENRIFLYWQRCRERQHKQYHTSLKIQHGTLEKEKAMIDLYEKTMSGKVDKATMSKQLQKAGVVLSLLQDTQTATAHFCETALKELHIAQGQGQELLFKVI